MMNAFSVLEDDIADPSEQTVAQQQTQGRSASGPVGPRRAVPAGPVGQGPRGAVPAGPVGEGPRRAVPVGPVGEGPRRAVPAVRVMNQSHYRPRRAVPAGPYVSGNGKANERTEEITLKELEQRRSGMGMPILQPTTDQRKVDTTEFESMQKLPKKKDTDDTYLYVGSGKDKKKGKGNSAAQKHVTVSLNQFLSQRERYPNDVAALSRRVSHLVAVLRIGEPNPSTNSEVPTGEGGSKELREASEHSCGTGKMLHAGKSEEALKMHPFLQCDNYCCLLKDFLDLPRWNGNRLSWEYQALLRSIIAQIDWWNAKRALHGPLSESNILVIKFDTYLRAELSHKKLDNSNCGSDNSADYIAQFGPLVSKILGEATSDSDNYELKHFLQITRCRLTPSQFQKLRFHPLLIPYVEKDNFLSDCYSEFWRLWKDGLDWREDYKKELGDYEVDLHERFGNEMGFDRVLRNIKYKRNLVGALHYARNACHHAHDHFLEDLKKKKEGEMQKAKHREFLMRKDKQEIADEIEKEDWGREGTIAKITAGLPLVFLEAFTYMFRKNICLDQE